MNKPEGLWHDEQHRYFYRGKGPLPGVSSIAKVIDKSGPLVGWAKRETAKSAIRNIDVLAQMIRDGGPESAQRWLSSIPDYQRDVSADMGHRVHALASAHMLGQTIAPSPDETPYLRAHLQWLNRVRPKIIMSEVTIANLTLGYGGTLDLGVEWDGVPTLLDIKTGNGVYGETAIQLAGYDGGEFWATPDDPTQRPLPKWERYGVIHLRPDAAWLIPFDITDADRDAFRNALTLHRWVRERSNTVMMKPIDLGVTE